MTVAHTANAGRSRDGNDHDFLARGTEAPPLPRARALPRKAPPARPLRREPQLPPDAERLDWSDPFTKIRINNALDSEVFAFLHRHELILLRQLVHHRNAHNGRCDPSRERLAFETGYKLRRLDDAIGNLVREPGSEAGVLPAHDLVVRETRRWRGVQTSSRYWFTPRFYELLDAYERGRIQTAHTVRQSATTALSRAQPLRPNKTLSSLSPDPRSSFQNRSLEGVELGPRAQARTESPPPMDLVQGGGEPTRQNLDAFETMVAIFWAKRAVRYDERAQPRQRGDTVSTADREELGEYVRNLAARAANHAAMRDRTVDRGVVLTELCTHLVEKWLDHPGKDGFLSKVAHPLPRLLDDYRRFGEDALERWCGRLTRPRPVQPAQPIERATPTAPQRPPPVGDQYFPALDFRAFAGPLRGTPELVSEAGAEVVIDDLEGSDHELDGVAAEQNGAEVVLGALQVVLEGAEDAFDDLVDPEGAEVMIGALQAALGGAEVVIDDLVDPEGFDHELDTFKAEQDGAEIVIGALQAALEGAEDELDIAVVAHVAATEPETQEIVMAVGSAPVDSSPLLRSSSREDEIEPDPQELAEIEAARAELAALVEARSTAPPRRPPYRTGRR